MGWKDIIIITIIVVITIIIIIIHTLSWFFFYIFGRISYMSTEFMSFPPYSLPYQLLLCPPTPSQIYDPFLFLHTHTHSTCFVYLVLLIGTRYPLFLLLSHWSHPVKFSSIQGVRLLDTLSL